MPQSDEPKGSNSRQDRVQRQEVSSGPTASYLLAAIVESADDAIISKDLDGTITSWNPGATRIFGYTADEMIGQPLLILIPPELRPEEAQIIEKIRSGQNVEHYETERLRKDGSRVRISLTVSPIKGPDGDIIGASKIARDITASKQAEQVQHETEERFRLALSSGAVTVYEQGLDLRYKWVYPEAPYRDDIIGRTDVEISPGPEAEFRQELKRKVVETGQSIRHEVIGHALSGPRWYDLLIEPRRNADGNIIGIVGTALDITERKRAEQAVLRSQAEAERQRRLYDTILSNTPDLAYVFDLDHRFIYANDVLLRMWGKTWEEAIGKNCLELGYPDWHAEMHDREIEKVKATRQPIRGEVPFAGTFGYRIYEYIFVPIFGTDGEVEAVAGTTRDVTERKRNELNLAFLSEISADLARLSTVAEVIDVVGAKIGHHFCLSNCGFVEIDEGSDRATMIGEWLRGDARSIKGIYRFSEYLSEDFQRSGRAGEPFVVDDVHSDPRTDGERYRALGIESFVCIPLVRAGEWRFMLCMYDSHPRNWQPDEVELARELTARVEMRLERARAELALQESMEREKTARKEAEAANRAKDEFLAILSHELRTPLHAMKGWASLLLTGTLDDERRRQAVDVIARNLDAQNALVDDLLDVSRIVSGKLTIEREPVSFVSVVANVIEELRPAAEAKGIRVRSELDATAGKVRGDQNRLRQIVTNLLNNAIKFTPPVGSVTVRLENSGSESRLIVADTGIGIGEEMLPRIFDRFQQADSTSRRGYGGLGLGLAIVKHLVALHGGTISVASGGQNQGAEFTVDLPVIAPTATVIKNASESNGSQNGAKKQPLAGRHILVVEDDPDSLALLQVVLSRYGASVSAAASTAEAVTALQGRRFDLLVSDLGLPDRDGYDLIATVRGQLGLTAEVLPAAALSGYVSHEDRQRSTAAGYQIHLSKPLDLGVFPSALLSLLQGDSQVG